MKECIVVHGFHGSGGLMYKRKKVKNEMNPFYETYSLLTGTSLYKIENKHYLPAFKEGIAQHNRDIEQIVNNSAA